VLERFQRIVRDLQLVWRIYIIWMIDQSLRLNVLLLTLGLQVGP